MATPSRLILFPLIALFLSISALTNAFAGDQGTEAVAPICPVCKMVQMYLVFEANKNGDDKKDGFFKNKESEDIIKNRKSKDTLFAHSFSHNWKNKTVECEIFQFLFYSEIKLSIDGWSQSQQFMMYPETIEKEFLGDKLSCSVETISATYSSPPIFKMKMTFTIDGKKVGEDTWTKIY